MGLRDRIQERRGDDGTVHYQMREKILSIGDDSWIEDSNGNRAFKVNGKALRVRDTIAFEDANGNELLKIQDRVARVRDTMEIEDSNGNNVATIKKALISPFRDRYSVSVANGPDLDIKGNILDHEYTFEADGNKVAEVSKKWFRVRDTYGVEVSPGQNVILMLALTAAVDSISAPGD